MFSCNHWTSPPNVLDFSAASVSHSTFIQCDQQFQSFKFFNIENQLQTVPSLSNEISRQTLIHLAWVVQQIHSAESYSAGTAAIEVPILIPISQFVTALIWRLLQSTALTLQEIWNINLQLLPFQLLSLRGIEWQFSNTNWILVCSDERRHNNDDFSDLQSNKHSSDDESAISS